MTTKSKEHQEQQLSLYQQFFHHLGASSSSSPSKDDDVWIFPDNMDNPNRNNNGMTSIEIKYTASQIPHSYNQPKMNDNIKYSDDREAVDGEDMEPYRHIKHYYIYKKSKNKKVPPKRIPLPINGHVEVPRDMVIAGWLQPPPKPSSSSTTTTTVNDDLPPVFVTIDNIKSHAVIDRSRLNRGYWIIVPPSTSKKGSGNNNNNNITAWYYLQEPCDYKLPSNSNTIIESQAKIQWDATVVMTCVSVLLEQVLEADPNSIHQTIEDTLQESSLLLQQPLSQEEVVYYDSQVLYEFELNIIATYRTMIIQHLNDAVPGCTDSCNWMKSIAKLKKPSSTNTTTTTTTTVAVQLWVQLICNQLQQHLWGGVNRNTTDIEHHNQLDIMNNLPPPYKHKVVIPAAATTTTTTTTTPTVTHDDTMVVVTTKSVNSNNSDNVKKRQKSPDDNDTNLLEDHHVPTKKPKLAPFLKDKADKYIFSALALKEQLDGVATKTRIPNIQYDFDMEDWTETTSWESIVANYGSTISLVGDKDDAKSFYDHIMQDIDIQMEFNTLVVHALANLEPTSKYYKSLMNHKSSCGQRPITYIFNNLMNRALDIFDERIASHQTLEQSSAMYLVANILLLMVKREDVKSNSLLASLKKTAHVDWISCLEEVQCRIKKMSEHSLSIPEYLKVSLKKAEKKMSQISEPDKSIDAVADGKGDPPITSGAAQREVNIPRKKSDSIELSKSEPVVPRKNSIVTSGTDAVPMKIPRKSSIDKKVSMEVKTVAQSSVKASGGPTKVNLTSLLSMKGVTKEAMVDLPKKIPTYQHHLDPKLPPNQQMNDTAHSWDKSNPTAPPPHQQQFHNNNTRSSWDNNKHSRPPNEQRQHDQSWDYRYGKPPPLQQQQQQQQQQMQLSNTAASATSWESKNMCGWGDVAEMDKESSSTINTLPSVKETFRNIKR